MKLLWAQDICNSSKQITKYPKMDFMLRINDLNDHIKYQTRLEIHFYHWFLPFSSGPWIFTSLEHFRALMEFDNTGIPTEDEHLQ